MALGEMSPTLIIDNETHTGIGHTKLSHQFFERSPSLSEFTHLNHLLWFKFAVNTLTSGLAVLLNFIGRVFLIGCKKQVVRTYTQGSIASVADTHPTRDRTISPLPCIAVSPNHSPWLTQLKTTISLCRASPVPARLGFPHILVKTLRWIGNPAVHTRNLIPVRGTTRGEGW